MDREITLKVKENSYNVKFPNQGQFQDIENLKMVLSNGMYGSLQAASTTDSMFALDLIDAEAYFTILVSDLVKDLKVKSFRELELEDSIVIREVFVNQMVPFIKSWRDLIREAVNKKNEEK